MTSLAIIFIFVGFALGVFTMAVVVKHGRHGQRLMRRISAAERRGFDRGLSAGLNISSGAFGSTKKAPGSAKTIPFPGHRGGAR